MVRHFMRQTSEALIAPPKNDNMPTETPLILVTVCAWPIELTLWFPCSAFHIHTAHTSPVSSKGKEKPGLHDRIWLNEPFTYRLCSRSTASSSVTNMRRRRPFRALTTSEPHSNPPSRLIDIGLPQAQFSAKPSIDHAATTSSGTQRRPTTESLGMRFKAAALARAEFP